jgi:hypothetical protein
LSIPVFRCRWLKQKIPPVSTCFLPMVQCISVLWIPIRKDPKLFAGSGSVTRCTGSGYVNGNRETSKLVIC